MKTINALMEEQNETIKDSEIHKTKEHLVYTKMYNHLNWPEGMSKDDFMQVANDEYQKLYNSIYKYRDLHNDYKDLIIKYDNLLIKKSPKKLLKEYNRILKVMEEIHELSNEDNTGD